MQHRSRAEQKFQSERGGKEMVIQSSNIGMRSERYYRKREEEVKSLQLWGTSKNGQDELQMGNALKEGGVDAKRDCRS